MNPLPQARMPAEPAAGLAADYLRIRTTTTDLASTLEPEDFVVQTMPDVSPAKWHLAHVTWFFEKFVLRPHAPGYSPFDERFDYIFNSYYFTVGPMHLRPERGFLSRPTTGEIKAYRRHVDAAMLRLLEERVGDEDISRLVTLGLNHEQQHQELLLTDIKHVFSRNPLLPALRETPPTPAGRATELRFVARDAGIREIGAEGDGFSFDNERPRHQVLLHEHALGSRLVTNTEFREFIDDGGYAQPDLWLSDGWGAVQQHGWNRPLYWSEDLGQEFTLGGLRDIVPYAPVTHVSYYEADAYARWAGARLPTETEWETAAEEVEVAGNFAESGMLHPSPYPLPGGEGDKNAIPGGEGGKNVIPGGEGDQNGGPSPYPLPGGEGDKEREAIRQLFGDVWEWTQSAYSPYPGFQPLAGSLGEYNGKFMCNQWVVRGGSCATALSHIRPSYRSFFYPHQRWQFLGIRLAKD